MIELIDWIQVFFILIEFNSIFFSNNNGKFLNFVWNHYIDELLIFSINFFRVWWLFLFFFFLSSCSSHDYCYFWSKKSKSTFDQTHTQTLCSLMIFFAVLFGLWKWKKKQFLCSTNYTHKKKTNLMMIILATVCKKKLLINNNLNGCGKWNFFSWKKITPNDCDYDGHNDPCPSNNIQIQSTIENIEFLFVAQNWNDTFFLPNFQKQFLIIIIIIIIVFDCDSVCVDWRRKKKIK